MKTSRTAIFGGSFNPVHNGHVNLVREAVGRYCLDNVIAVPAFISPFKEDKPPVEGIHRVNMCRLAFSRIPEVTVSDCEIRAGDVSYTYNTLRYFSGIYPKGQLFLLLGGDVEPTLSMWHRADEILELANILTVPRKWDISSTVIREKLMNNEDVSRELPRNVAEYIRENKLYVRGTGSDVTHGKGEINDSKRNLADGG